MPFEVKLEVDGNEYRVLECSYDLNRDTDNFGKPASGVRGGKVHVTIESSGDTSFFEWMTSPYTRKAGKLIFMKPDEEAELKVLEFEDSYLVGYSEEFDDANNKGMSEDLVISAKTIKLGGGEHQNDWPV